MDLLPNKPQDLNNFDFSSIESLNPFTRKGYQLLYENRISCLIRICKDKQSQQQQDQNIIEEVIVSVYTRRNAQKEIEEISIQLSSLSDLFFLYYHIISKDNYEAINQEQGIQATLDNYSKIIVGNFENCVNNSDQFALLFGVYENREQQLSVVQTFEFKNVEIINFEMKTADVEMIRAHAQFTYGSLISKLKIKEGRLQDVGEMILLKNPYLELEVKKLEQEKRVSKLKQKESTYFK